MNHLYNWNVKNNVQLTPLSEFIKGVCFLQGWNCSSLSRQTECSSPAVSPKEIVQGSYYTNSTWLYSAIAKPNMYYNQNKESKASSEIYGSDM